SGAAETGTISRVLRSGMPGLKGGQTIVRVDPRYFRPTEVDTLRGDARKAQEKLGWTPRVKFPELVAEMMCEDLKAAQRDDLVRRHGFSSYDHNE
ncbi:MAG: GDP-mannose 4,6-dehydratase, partial [Acidiferrobacterales bacterium]